jgi:hypothetical protein
MAASFQYHRWIQAKRAAAVAESEAVTGHTVEQVLAQGEAEDALGLDRRKRKNKGYAWSLGLKDKARIQKTGKLSPKHQQEITVKVRFFEGEAKTAYIQTIAPALDQFPEQVTEILAEPGSTESGSTESGSSSTQQAPGLTCDINQKQWVLQYEGQPEKARCMAVWTDPEYAHDYFDSNIDMHSAVGYAVEGTTWQNVAYSRFKVMLVNYRNGTSEYFMLDDIGDFQYGSKVHGMLGFTYLKRATG